MNDDRTFAAICRELDITASTPDEALSQTAEAMRTRSSDLDVLMVYMRRAGASIYSLSKHSGLSESAVRGRLRSQTAQHRLAEIEGWQSATRYAVVDLERLNESTRAEIEASLSDGDNSTD